jgi:hypothetical protein
MDRFLSGPEGVGSIKKLSNLLTNSQLDLLLNVLAQVCASGYGEVNLVIMDGKIKFFRVTFSIPSTPECRPTR